MSNPSSISDTPAVLEATNGSDLSVTIDADREYVCYHNGVDTSLAVAAGAIVLALSAAVDADGSAGADKALLIDGGPPITIGPGVSTLKFESAGGSPTMTIVPSPPFLRKWWSD